MQHVTVPQDRIGVVIGAGGETMREIEARAGVRLAIEETDDPVAALVAPDVVKAIGRGFNPETALSILDHDLRTLELVDLTEHTRNDNDLQRKKGRIIGENGRTRELLEELTGADVVVYGSTVGAVGGPEELQVVRRAVGMLLDGAPHGAVYSYLERKSNELNDDVSFQPPQ
jgi:ribosomal RNA assembly protein